jgi:hypothetical protein
MVTVETKAVQTALQNTGKIILICDSCLPSHELASPRIPLENDPKYIVLKIAAERCQRLSDFLLDHFTDETREALDAGADEVAIAMRLLTSFRMVQESSKKPGGRKDGAA